MGKGGGGGGIASSAMDAAAKMFLQSNTARRMLFRNIATAMKTPRGLGGGLVQMGIARSREAGQQAMRIAGAGLPPGISGMARSRIMNRIQREGLRETAAIQPGLAARFQAAAPGGMFGAVGAQRAGLEVAAQGQAAALQAAATRAAGWAKAAESVAGAVGGAAGTPGVGSWFTKFFKSGGAGAGGGTT